MNLRKPPFFQPSNRKCDFSRSARPCQLATERLHDVGLVPVRVRFVHAQAGLQVQFWRVDDAGDELCHAFARH